MLKFDTCLNVKLFLLQCFPLKNLLVEQGCGDSPKEVKDIQYAVCDKPLCNTKELFDKTLFCFIKDSQKEKYKKAIKQCDKECFVYRDGNGHCI